MGIKPDPALYRIPSVADGTKKPTFLVVATMVRAAVRMKRGAEEWAQSRKLHDRLLQGLEAMRKKERVKKRKSLEGVRTQKHV